MKNNIGKSNIGIYTMKRRSARHRFARFRSALLYYIPPITSYKYIVDIIIDVDVDIYITDLLDTPVTCLHRYASMYT